MRISEILSKEKLKQLYEDLTRRGFLGALGLGALGAGGYAAYNKLNKEPEPPKKPQPQPQPVVVKPVPKFVPLEYKDELIVWAKENGLTTDRDLANFFGQIYVETSKWTRAEENLNYKTPAIIYKTFTSKFKNVAETQKYVNNPEALANYVYANRNGNGDVNSGDGWKYRGRGFIHLTGRELYQKAGKAVHPENPNIYINNPDLLSTNPKESALASIWYFKVKVGLGKTVAQTTRKVNPAGLKSRERYSATQDYRKQFKKDK
jgi:predicted chitinase